MKREILNIGWALAATAALSSCDSFLEESPKTFLSPKYYFQTENQITAGVNGLYTFVDDIFDGDIEVGTQNFIFLDYLPGYGIRPRAASSLYLSQALNLSVTEESTHVENLWKSSYFAIENCNGVIAGIEAAKNVEIAEDTRNKLLGEAYFLRAYNYFNLVRLYGPVPLKTKTTSDLSQAQLPLSSEEAIYEVIVTDLTQAEKLMENAPWTSTDGRVTKGAVKSMLAKVYLTMAGYPLQKGGEYYRMAYEKAHEVYLGIENYLRDHGVEMLFGCTCEDVILRDGRCCGVVAHDGHQDYTIEARHTVIATGRRGADWLEKVCLENGVEHKPGTVDIGVRVEVRNEIMESVNRVLYESKLIGYPAPFKNKVRTFCQNPGGFVSQENYDNDLAVVNGHAYKELKSPNTNVAILCSHNFSVPFNQPIAYAQKVGELTNMLGAGHIMVQRFGDILDGKRTWQKELMQSNVRPTLPDAVAGDITSAMPYRAMLNIINFIKAMDEVVPGFAAYETLLYSPELKFYSNRIAMDADLNTNVPGLHCLGDSSGWTRGLMMASAMGVLMGRKLAGML